MNTGMLWFDNDPKTTLAAKIEKAADYYRHKYGNPNVCLVHPSVNLAGVTVDGIEIRIWRPVLPHHLWIGEDESANRPPASS